MKDREMACINRLFKDLTSYDEILSLLVNEKFVDKSFYSQFMIENNKGKLLFDTFNDLKEQGKILMVSYIWEILPQERICITVVTANLAKDFKYNHVGI